MILLNFPDDGLRLSDEALPETGDGTSKDADVFLCLERRGAEQGSVTVGEAQDLSARELAAAITHPAMTAREGKASASDQQGGTITYQQSWRCSPRPTIRCVRGPSLGAVVDRHHHHLPACPTRNEKPDFRSHATLWAHAFARLRTPSHA